MIKVIGLSMYDDSDGGGKMRAAGADVYVCKSEPPEELIRAIRQSGHGAGIDETRGQKRDSQEPVGRAVP